MKPHNYSVIQLQNLKLKTPRTFVTPFSLKKAPFSFLNPQETEMETPVALNVAQVNAPHRDLDYLPLADRDFQMKDLTFDDSPLRLHCKYQDLYLNNVDNIGLWESNLPKYQFPSVHILPDIVH